MEPPSQRYRSPAKVGMQRLSFYLSDQQISALKGVAGETGISLSEIIRRAIDAFIVEQNGDPKPPVASESTSEVPR